MTISKSGAKNEVLDALGEFSLALEEAEKVLLTPEVPTDQVALCLSLMSAGLAEVRARIEADL